MRGSITNQIGAVILMGILSVGNIGFAHSGIWNTSAGTSVDISTMDVAAYQVDSVSQLKDGVYIVAGTAYGYQSDIKVEVTFDAAGAVVQNVEILSQAETEGLGANIIGSGFREQFIGKEAPFGLKDKDMVILVPGTGAVLGAGAAAIGLNEVDAVSSATISSTAVVQVIDYAYFFLQDQVLQE